MKMADARLKKNRKDMVRFVKKQPLRIGRNYKNNDETGNKSQWKGKRQISKKKINLHQMLKDKVTVK